MKRFFRKLGSWLWPWGFLKVALWTITLIVLFYAENDWRGARAWAATKAKWEARGETFDFNKLAPSPVPDDRNLAALPLFNLEPDPDHKGNLRPLALEKALRLHQPGGEFPSGALGSQEKGRLPDMRKIRDGITLAYAEAFKTDPAGKTTLSQFEALYPFVAPLRDAAMERPFCDFQPVHGFETFEQSFAILTDQIPLSRILTFHAVLALEAHRPDLALDDLKTNFKLGSGLRSDPLLVSGLCAIGTAAFGFSALRDGLAHHAWNDAQLAGIENELAAIDFLAAYQADLRGEACFSITAFDRLKAHRPGYGSHLNARNGSDLSRRKTSDMFRDLWADGWIDWMKAQAGNVDLNAVGFVDPKARRVYPELAERFSADVAARQHGWSNNLWHILTDEAAGPIVEAVRHFAQAQAYADEARIACALERYRLANGAYPVSLNVLAPTYFVAVPRDVINNQPYRYRLQPDGSRIIYSVGWNGVDDGGTVAYRADAPQAIDEKQGDWVWVISKWP